MVVGLFGSTVAGWAIITTLFSDLDTYLERGTDILVAKAVSIPTDVQADFGDGLHLAEVDVLRTLKGTNQPGTTTIATIYPMIVGRVYLLYSLGGSAGGSSFLAVPELSVVEVPSGFDLRQLDGKPPRAQIVLLFDLRLAELKRHLAELQQEKIVLEKAVASGKAKDPRSSTK
jgi:hypothetical protein